MCSPSTTITAGTFGLDEEEYAELGDQRLAMQNMFRTVDATDYALIASVNVRHRIEQMALDTTGQSLALVEKVGENSSSEPITQCRIYTVGRKRVSWGCCGQPLSYALSVYLQSELVAPV